MVIGTCDSMCSQHEISLRKDCKRVTAFEWKESLFVKEYSRSAAGRTIKAEEIRTPSGLNMTLKHLLENVLDIAKHKENLIVTMDFITDRLRAVRQDIVIQRLPGAIAVPMLEKIVRYHIYINYVLKEAEAHHFDPAMNDTLLNTYICNLLEYYDIDRLQKQSFEDEVEFRSYFVLLNMSNSLTVIQALKWFHLLSKANEQRKELQTALDLCKAYNLRNFFKFFAITSNLTFLQSCCLLRTFTRLRIEFLDVINTAYSSKHFSFPLHKLQIWLRLDSVNDVGYFLGLCGHDAKNDSVTFNKNHKQTVSLISLQKCTGIISYTDLVETRLGADLTPCQIVNSS
ncbi:uncharacterized protein LOC130645287 isoform X2 [Hydractinia symbiolongicarpus]|uniref:uncharacterized protein LOC130645287 isoform X2 n=1 Tax=Hydractinia symbiolongicarpus TaxID=13093 RepID=UPI00254DFD73|nr:uncharacterized protein LOC130645287 isoform X2 [Hydractinia symbiolongicarpus]XP_057307213.1 uncharacterized protein LOC130645287 isoform X2 [Hydractinia symbiolongicarpus]